MNSHVCVELSFLLKSFPTFGTLMRSLSCVNSHVLIQLLFMNKTFSTERANMLENIVVLIFTQES